MVISCGGRRLPDFRGTFQHLINGEEECMQVFVRDNNVDQALKVLKKKMQREGILREIRLRGAYEKPSERRVREKAEAIRRVRKLARKKLQREGLLPMPKAKPKLPPRPDIFRASRPLADPTPSSVSSAK
jgi:small subunit ribosomal protein S21